VHGKVHFILLDGSRELITDRMKKRKGHFMPPALLDSQFATLEEPGPDEAPIIIDISTAPKAAIADAIRQLKARDTGESLA
jgi:gluconokinase